MEYEVTMRATFQFNKGVEVAFVAPLEISLDCFQCVRTRRTVVINGSGSLPFCTPSRHVFPVQVLSTSVQTQGRQTIVAYRLRYDFRPFADAKDGDPADVLPKWGRINFVAVCPVCKHGNEESVQNNIARPWKACCQQCGYVLYTERDEMPVFEMAEAA